MSNTTSINSLSSGLSYLLENQVVNNNNSTSNSSSVLSELQSLTGSQQSDNSQLSPLADVLDSLQQLQQSDPTKYSEVTSQIASNLATAAQTASADGNTSAANQLTQLSTDFKTASTSGNLPNIQDLARAIGGGGHHHHHSGASSSSDSNSGTDNTSSSTSQSPLSQLLSAVSTGSLRTTQRIL